MNGYNFYIFFFLNHVDISVRAAMLAWRHIHAHLCNILLDFRTEVVYLTSNGVFFLLLLVNVLNYVFPRNTYCKYGYMLHVPLQIYQIYARWICNTGKYPRTERVEPFHIYGKALLTNRNNHLTIRTPIPENSSDIYTHKRLCPEFDAIRIPGEILFSNFFFNPFFNRCKLFLT